MGRVIVDLPLPRLGETMDEGRIGQLLKKPGQAFRRGETLLEVESDKTTVEVPALNDGVLVEWLVVSDQTVPVETAIAKVEVDEKFISVTKQKNSEMNQKYSAPVGPVSKPRQGTDGPRIRASTAARAAARKLGLDLSRVPGSGRSGRVTRADLSRDLPAQRSIYRLQTQSADFFVREWPAQGAEKGAVVLLHGLFAESQSFTTLGRKLASTGFRVLALDLPAHGDTHSQLTDASEIAATIASALSVKRVHIIGHSFGAVVASLLAYQHPDRVVSLILLAPGGAGEEIKGEFLQAMLAGRIDEALKYLGENVPVEAVAALAESIDANKAQLRKIVEAVADGGKQRRTILSLLASLSVPVTAVFMRDDPVIPASQALNMPPNVAVRFLPGASHLPHWRDPDFIVRLLSAHGALA